MSTYKQHCAECQQELGKAWEVVHRWLDYYASHYFPDPVHRIFRHHKQGVEEVRKMWGDDAAKAAELHIIADIGQVFDEKELNKHYGAHITGGKAYDTDVPTNIP